MSHLILSNDLNYQSEIESAFSTFLHTSKASAKTITNYRSDLHSFLTWFYTSDENTQNTPSDASTMLSSISNDTIHAYKSSLLLSRTPSATINRRLSALRMFFHFAVTKGLTTTNPLKNINNIKSAKEHSKITLLTDFTAYMADQGASEKTKTNYRVDINHFLIWMRKSSNSPHLLPQRGELTDQELLFHADTAIIETYVRDQNDTKIPVATINRRLSALRMMYQFLITSYGLTSSPVEAVKNLTSDPMKLFTPLINTFCDEDTDSLFNKEEKQSLIEDFIRWRVSPA